MTDGPFGFSLFLAVFTASLQGLLCPPTLEHGGGHSSKSFIFLIQELLNRSSTTSLRPPQICVHARLFRGPGSLVHILIFSRLFLLSRVRWQGKVWAISPRIGDFYSSCSIVRHIIVSINIRWLSPVSAMTFPSLREITIRSTTFRADTRVVETMEKSLPTIQAYLRAPDMERVNFNGYFPLAILDSYFADCSQKIGSLGLDLRHIGHPAETNGQQTATALPKRKIELSHVTLLNSKIVSQWLIRPRSAFAVSHLRSVETDARTWYQLQDSLASTLPSIESLILTDFSDTRHLELSKLPALRLLDAPFSQIYAEEYSYSFDQYARTPPR
ncbi:hypothetical protein B0H13DRAFT_2523008 [Mycena leptocephala]|nr:hypothetical protein B0H13DRAFT_2523008 [Mycena leptocephala]